MISLIAAVDTDGILGDTETNGLPWFCRTDLEHFRSLTWGSDLVLGRKTWEDMPDSVQEGRRIWVVTSEANGTETDREPSRTEFFPINRHLLNTDRHVVIGGGASIYEQALATKGLVDRAFLTRLPISSGGNVKWPGLPEEWEKVRDKKVSVSEKLLEYDTSESATPHIHFEEWTW